MEMWLADSVISACLASGASLIASLASATGTLKNVTPRLELASAAGISQVADTVISVWMVTMETLFLDLASSVVLALALGILALIITTAAHVMLTEIPTTLFASVHLVIQVCGVIVALLDTLGTLTKMEESVAPASVTTTLTLATLSRVTRVQACA